MDSNSQSPEAGSRPVDPDAEAANPDAGSASISTGRWAAISIGVGIVMGVVGSLADMNAVIDKIRQDGLAAMAPVIVILRRSRGHCRAPSPADGQQSRQRGSTHLRTVRSTGRRPWP